MHESVDQTLGEPLDPPFPPTVDRSKPRHHFFAEESQYRIKLRTFSGAPPEVTIQNIHMDRDVDAYMRAADRGLSRVPRPRRVRSPDSERDQESIDRSQRRAKTLVRLCVTELAPSSLVTFTTRKVYSLDDLVDIWGRFVRLARMVGSFEYVCVPEPHPSNPDHLHLHAAVRGKLSRDTLRRLWHIALEAHEGRRVTSILRGAASPGNIDDQPIKGRDTIKRIRKIARYISKYITKDLLERFNRRRYWPSKGINLRDAQVFWLDSLSMSDAVREACQLLGHWNGFAPSFRVFCPSDRVAWWAVDPEAMPPPPF